MPPARTIQRKIQPQKDPRSFAETRDLQKEAAHGTVQTVVCEAASEHCFIGKDGKLLNLKKEYPAFYELLVELARPA